MLRDADRLFAPVVAGVLQAVEIGPEDAGIVRLAEEYARTLDENAGDPETLARLGPKLLTALEALGGSPRSRSLLRRGEVPSRVESRLRVLREASSARRA